MRIETKDSLITNEGLTIKEQKRVFGGVTEKALQRMVDQYNGHPLELAREMLNDLRLSSPEPPRPANFEDEQRLAINRLVWVLDYIRYNPRH